MVFQRRLEFETVLRLRLATERVGLKKSLELERETDLERRKGHWTGSNFQKVESLDLVSQKVPQRVSQMVFQRRLELERETDLERRKERRMESWMDRQ
jgi:hypothetical protein